VTSGSTPAAASQALRVALQQTVSCVTADVLIEQADAVASEFTVASRLGSRSRGGHLTLSIRHYYAVVADTSRERRHRWQTHTTGYYYTLDDADGREILAYHWHPTIRSPVTFPHLHLGAGVGTLRSELTKAHLQTGFITPVALLTLVVEQFGVRPRRADWSTIFERAGRALEMP